MALNLSSEITISEEAPKTRLIAGVQTAILAAAGVTERGPHEVTLVTSFEEYLQIFGGDTVDSDLTHAVRGYFDEGGYAAYIKRVVHYSDIDDDTAMTSASGSVTLQSGVESPGAGSLVGTVAGPWELAPGDDLDIAVDGDPAATATFAAAAAVATGTETETFTLSDGQTLIIEVDGGSAQTVTFLDTEFSNIALATALEVAAVINAKLAGASADTSAGAVRITSDTKGTDSHIEVTGGTAAAELGLASADEVGTGDVGDITAVTFAEAKDVIENDVSGVTVTEASGGYLRITSNTVGVDSSVQVESGSTADDEFGLDNALHEGDSGAAVDALEVAGKTDGAYTDTIRIIIEDASSGDDDYFNLSVEDDGVVVESFANLSMDPTDDYFAEDIINSSTNGSNLISVDEPTPALGKRPANGTSSYLSGGDDGLTSLAEADYIGSSIAKTGLYGFDTVSDASLLIVPGVATTNLQLAMLTYCEVTKEMSMFAILDCPSDYTASEMVTYVETTAQLLNRSEFGAIYYPRGKVLNPDEAIFGSDSTITVPLSGHIAGVYARVDASRSGGVYQPPAGIDRGRFYTVLGLENDETKEKSKRNILYPKRINPISIIGGQLAIDGVRTLRGDSNFPTIAERRGVIYIEQSLKDGLEFARYRNNDAELRAEVRRAIVLFLIVQMKNGAFRSKVPSEAFLVDVSEALNPPSVVFSGRLNVRVGLATQKPAEFINLVFSQDTRALDAEVAAAGA